MPTTYSFLDTQVSLTGPGGSISLGAGAGNSEEGITFEPVGDINTMTVGADGSVMHSLHADKSAKCAVKLLKTSPVNAQLSAMVAFQRTSGALHGQNTITLANGVTGDTITAQQVAFARIPNIDYAKDGGMLSWEFHIGVMDPFLGAGL